MSAARRCRLLCAWLVFFAGATAHAFSSGPPPDKVGLCAARGTCADATCHEGGLGMGTALSRLELDTGPLPATYRPGEVLRFVLSVVDPDPSRVRIGFQLASVVDCPFAAQAGAIQVVEPSRTEAATAGGITFLRHTCLAPPSASTCGYVPVIPPSPDSNAWTFDWMAPPTSVGTVKFYWAVNSADGSFDSSGDFISLWEASLDPACPGRVGTLRAVARPCDPAAPGVVKVELSWDPIPFDLQGYRIYRTEDPAVLADPGAGGADLLPLSCDLPPVSGPLHFYSVVGVCADLSDGPP